MTGWTDLTREQREIAALLAVGELTATMNTDELRHRAARTRSWLGRDDHVAALFEHVADAREAREAVTRKRWAS